MENDFETLELRTPYMHGPAVMRLQELLELSGMSGGGNDGIFGPRTQMSVKKMQVKMGRIGNGVCDRSTYEAIIRNLDKRYVNLGAKLVDRRLKHDRPRLYGKRRTWNDITGITLHQTGCLMPIRPHSWDRLNAHIGITRDGIAVIVNDPTDMIWHAQGLSKSTIGIEIAGNYEGIKGDSGTLWSGGGGPHNLSLAMINGLRAAIEWIKVQFAVHGKKIEHVYAHRQSAKSRIADPGSEIWSRIALPLMSELGINPSMDRDVTSGQGRPIPVDWDCHSDHPYYEPR